MIHAKAIGCNIGLSVPGARADPGHSAAAYAKAARRFMAGSRARNTRRAYGADLRDYEGFAVVVGAAPCDDTAVAGGVRNHGDGPQRERRAHSPGHRAPRPHMVWRYDRGSAGGGFGTRDSNCHLLSSYTEKVLAIPAALCYGVITG